MAYGQQLYFFDGDSGGVSRYDITSKTLYPGIGYRPLPGVVAEDARVVAADAGVVRRRRAVAVGLQWIGVAARGDAQGQQDAETDRASHGAIECNAPANRGSACSRWAPALGPRRVVSLWR